jgi:abhydrolase domain-containing protein 17
MTTLLTIGAVAAAAYGFLVLYAWCCADRMLFPAPEAGYRDGPRILKIPARDGTLLSAVHLEAAQPLATVLFLHGNGEDIAGILPQLEAMRARGFSVVAFDFRGYGTTPGRPSETNLNADTADVFRYLSGHWLRPGRQVIVYGRSLGGGPAIDLASRERVGGLVLEGAFVSAFRVVTQVRILPWDRFDNLSKIPRVTCPVLVIHGRRDETVPFHHGRQLFAAAPEPKRSLWVDDAGHNDLVEVAREAYWQALRTFAEETAGVRL